MQTTPRQTSAAADHRFRLIVWFAMLMSIAMYYLVMLTLKPGTPNADSTLPNILLPLSVAMAGISIPVRRVVARTKPRNAFVLAVVLCEISALFGVVLWTTTGSPWAYYCVLAGAVGMLFHVPRRGQSGANPE
jgi:uncharacterized membrane protein YhaH (DUF805 family)